MANGSKIQEKFKRRLFSTLWGGTTLGLVISTMSSRVSCRRLLLSTTNTSKSTIGMNFSENGKKNYHFSNAYPLWQLFSQSLWGNYTIGYRGEILNRQKRGNSCVTRDIDWSMASKSTNFIVLPCIIVMKMESESLGSTATNLWLLLRGNIKESISREITRHTITTPWWAGPGVLKMKQGI